MNWPENQREHAGAAARPARSAARRLPRAPQPVSVARARLNPRRHHHDDHDNQDRWLVSYADFITLLFAFFVVMYAMAMVSEGDFRALSNSIASAFTGERSAGPQPAAPVETPKEPEAAEPPPKITDAQLQEELRTRRRQAMRNMAGELQTMLASLVREGKVRVIENNRGITVEINESVLFSSGQARLEPGSVRALERVATVIAGTEFPIQVEGHTDNTPISTPQFPSNWELSASRAASVVRVFIDAGVDARRLSALGFSDQRPLVANDAVENRARNRRVNIMIEAPNLGSVSELPLPAAGAAAE